MLKITIRESSRNIGISPRRRGQAFLREKQSIKEYGKGRIR